MSALIANPTLRSLVKGMFVWAPLWIGTTVVFGCIGVGYVLFVKQDTFLASQALLVRDEATGAVMRLGRFQSQAEMKASQETILEMSKSQQVVRDALIAVGKPTSSSWLSWSEYPSKELVEDFAKNGISVHAPKGTEFGATEVIYLDVKANTQPGALVMSKALCDALEYRLQQVRKARADGVITELINARESAKRELAASTSRLQEMESTAGSDLSDLRGMTDVSSGSAASRTGFDQIKNEIRQSELTRHSLVADREMLIRAAQDPTSFIVAPGAVLNSQPGLKRLREGLVDAQLSGSQLSGRFTENHPLVVSSQAAQSSIVKRFMQELNASVASVESDMDLVDKKIERLEKERTSAEERLTRLADSRSTYANVLSEVKSRLAILEAADRGLGEAQAARDSSVSTSLLTRLDAPSVSDRPIGPGRTTLAGLCAIAGLVAGLGLVFVITPLDAGPSFGRRSLDRVRGRRATDIKQEQGVELPWIREESAFKQEPKLKPEEPPRPVKAETIPAKIQPTQQPLSQQPPPTRPQHVKLNLHGSSSNAVQYLANSIAELSSEIPKTSQALGRPSTVAVVPKTQIPFPPKSSNPDIDLAFQELSKLQSQIPTSRTEKFAKSKNDSLPITEDFQRQKPRPTKPITN